MFDMLQLSYKVIFTKTCNTAEMYNNFSKIASQSSLQNNQNKVIGTDITLLHETAVHHNPIGTIVKASEDLTKMHKKQKHLLVQ